MALSTSIVSKFFHKEKPGWIYFITPEYGSYQYPDWFFFEDGIIKGNIGYYKIGMTTRNPRQRISEIQKKHELPMELFHCFETDTPRAAESALHSIYDNHRVFGEWFLFEHNDAEAVRHIEGFKFGSFFVRSSFNDFEELHRIKPATFTEAY